MSRAVVSRRYATATPACSSELFMPCSIRSANVTNRPIRRPSVALFPLLAPSLSAPTYRPADGPHTRASGLIEDGTWDHPQRRTPGRATRRRGKGRLSLSPEKSRRYARRSGRSTCDPSHDPLARRVGRASCAQLYGALVGAVRGRSRECGNGTPFLILNANGVQKNGARGRRPPARRPQPSASGGL